MRFLIALALGAGLVFGVHPEPLPIRKPDYPRVRPPPDTLVAVHGVICARDRDWKCIDDDAIVLHTR